MSTSLYQLLPAFKHFQIIYAGLRLGIPAALARGPQSLQDLAVLSHIPEARLLKLLRGLVWADILWYDQTKGFGLKEEARCLLDSSPTSLASSIIFDGQFLYSAWGHFRDYVERGVVPFEEAQGCPIFDYLAVNPDLSLEYSRPMTARTSEYSTAVAHLSLFEGPKKIVDVGGGSGQLVLDILKCRPESAGVVYDLASVSAEAESNIRAAGLEDRCRFQAGDMFLSVPENGDVYILKWMIHDWNDQDAQRILSVIRATIPCHAVLILIERVMDDAFERGARLIQADLNMLVLSGGAERTLRQYSDLLHTSRFSLREAVPIERNYGFYALMAEPV